MAFARPINSGVETGAVGSNSYVEASAKEDVLSGASQGFRKAQFSIAARFNV
jgi:hypothetical protein